MNRIYAFLQSLNQCRWIVAVAIVALISFVLLRLRSFPVTVPDGKLFYNQQHLEQFFCLDAPPPALGNDLKDCEADCQGFRRLYIVTQLSLDTLLPLAYGTLMGIFIVRCYAKEIAKRCVLLPFLASASDLAENLILVWLAMTWKCGTAFPPLLRIAPWVSATKWVLVGACLALIVLGLIKKRPAKGQS